MITILSDFNCRIFDIDRFKIDSQSYSDYDGYLSRVCDDLNIFHRLNIHNLIYLITHNEDKNIRSTLSTIRRFDDFIKHEIPYGLSRDFRIKVAASVALTADVPYIKDLSRLSFGEMSNIFIEPPIFPDEAVIDESLNKILYNCKLNPMFVDFNRCLNFYSCELVSRLIKIKNASFIFSIGDVSEESIKTIKNLLKNNNRVLLSTGADHSKINEKDMQKNIAILRESLTLPLYRQIIVDSKKTFNVL